LLALGGEAMALECRAGLHLARRGHPEPLLRRALGLHLRHNRIPGRKRTNRPRRPAAPPQESGGYNRVTLRLQGEVCPFRGLGTSPASLGKSHKYERLILDGGTPLWQALRDWGRIDRGGAGAP